jgi:hypothetical protein
MVAAAISAGEKLLEAKDQLKHGEFGPFLTYCGVNARTARLYMRLARNRQHVAVLEAPSIRAAVAAIAGPSPRRKQPPNFGPDAGPSYANSREWQATMWAEAMLAEGRPAEEVRKNPWVRWCWDCDQLDPHNAHTCWRRAARAAMEDEA